MRIDAPYNDGYKKRQKVFGCNICGKKEPMGFCYGKRSQIARTSKLAV